jgi:Amt family ammonium transporter
VTTPTTFGAASGVVAITPSCGTVDTLGAAVVGLAAGIVCSFAVGAKFRFGYDDSLDVVGVHFVGGVVGVSLIGLLATGVMTGGAQGLFYGGGFAQLGKQSLGAVVVYAFAVSYVLAKVIDRFTGFRVSARGRDDRCRLHAARRDRLCEGSARASAVAPSSPFGDLGAPGPRTEEAEEG